MRAPQGYSLLELVFVMCTMATVSGVAIPQLSRTLDQYRAAAAARYLSARIQRTRMEAVSRSTNVAMRFVDSGAGYVFRVYMDGNGDGVRTQDITLSIDGPLGATERLPDNFPGVDFGLLPALPPVEAGSPPPGTDPIKLGASNILSYAATGTSSSGSLYIRGRRGSQYVVRVLGDTGRTRILKFDAHSQKWKPL
jgi:type II secretory pathway pseudopilin PulG